MTDIDLSNLEYLDSGRGSKVYKDNESGHVLKVFDPSRVSRIACRVLGFTSYPYSSSYSATQSAEDKRNLLNKLSERLFGEERFARAYGTCEIGGKHCLELEGVDGSIPKTREEKREAKRFLLETYRGLRRCGITCTDLNPRHPLHIFKGLRDVRILNEGYKILDCEPFCPHPTPEELLYFDGIDLERVREWYEMERRKTHDSDSSWFSEFETILESYETHSRNWEKDTPTIWHRAFSKTKRMEKQIQGILERGIERFLEEGRITSEQAETITGKIGEYKETLKGFVTHLAISSATPTGIGTILSSLLKPTSTLYYRKRTGDEKTHSKYVAIVSAIPAFGPFLGHPLQFLAREYKNAPKIIRIYISQKRYEKRQGKRH